MKLTAVAFKAGGMHGMNNEYNNISLHFRSFPPHRWGGHSEWPHLSLGLFQNETKPLYFMIFHNSCLFQASEPSQINHLILVSDWRHQGQSQDEPRRGQESRWREVTSNAIALQSGGGGVGRMANTSTVLFPLPFTHIHTNPCVPLTKEPIC